MPAARRCNNPLTVKNQRSDEPRQRHQACGFGAMKRWSTMRYDDLEPYNQAILMVGQHILRLRQLVNDNPEQQQRLNDAERLTTTRLGLIRKGIEVQQSREGGQPVSVETLNQEKQVMDEVRR